MVLNCNPTALKLEVLVFKRFYDGGNLFEISTPIVEVISYI